ncbi:hypothetical protein VNI00_017577 [Paramarasmius palmivorus]|uniref:Uncharacterized protein n=1 Tax=Paramarasmius palmivorus TaxID=297713 RepID=A0AAW0B663_9AGAR
MSELDNGPIKDVMTYLTMVPNTLGPRPPEYTSAMFLWFDLQKVWEAKEFKRGKMPLQNQPSSIHQWCKKGRV